MKTGTLEEKDIVRLWHRAVSECRSGAYIDMLTLFAKLVILEATSEETML